MNDGHPDRLPWLVAGRLDSPQARRLAEHLRSCDTCRAEAEALASMRRSLVAIHGHDHVGSDDLLAFSEDSGLSGARRAAIAAHLAGCGDCAEDERLLRGAAAPGAPRPAGGVRFTAGRHLGLAAALAAAVVALGVFIVARRMERPAPASGPAATRPEATSAVTLFASPSRGFRGPMVLAPGALRPITVLLPLDAAPGSYRLSLERPDGGVQSDGTPRAADENGVVRAMLPAITTPGPYRLVLRQDRPDGVEYPYEFFVAAPDQARPPGPP
jgi:hypothetical protein